MRRVLLSRPAVLSSIRYSSNNSAGEGNPPAPPSSSNSSPSAGGPKPKPLLVFDRQKHGMGGVELDFGKVNGTVDLFMKPDSDKKKSAPSFQSGGILPCDVPNSPAALHAASVGAGPVAPPPPSTPPPKPIQRSSLPKARPDTAVPANAKQTQPKESKEKQSQPEAVVPPYDEARAKEAAHYYSTIAPPSDIPSKDQLWSTLRSRKSAVAEENAYPPGFENATDTDYLRMDEDMKANDFIRYRYAEFFFRDETMRRKWLSMWNLAMGLNKARWQVHEVLMEKGTKSTGAAMRTLFWKEACTEILEKRSMVRGQFMDGHPVLRPYAATIQSTPNLTKSFVRGWVDARLKVQMQPANMKQLMEYFDKFYGYFYNTLLEILGVKDDNSEHMMMHIGRAMGITLHCVMFWKKYAALNTTLLPADLCADRGISVALLKNTALANRDMQLRGALSEMMSVAKTEMLHAEEIAKKVPVEAYPVVWECLYPNFYLGFLQKHKFNVSAYFADRNIDNPGYWWYCYKKQHQWIRNQSIPLLVSEAAPLPYTNICIGHKGSLYKVPAADPQTTNTMGTAPTGAQR